MQRILPTLVFAVFALTFSMGCPRWEASRSVPRPARETQQSGDLGVGVFTYVCLGAADRGCEPRSELPVVATGARFDLRYSNDAAAVVPVGAFVEPDGRGFRIVRPSYVGFLATRRGDSRVEDFVHLSAESPVAISVLLDEKLVSTPSFRLGDNKTLRLRLASKSTEDLAGTFDTLWQSADPSIVEVTSAEDNSATVRAKAVGQTKIVATAGGLSHEISVRVEDGAAAAVVSL